RCGREPGRACGGIEDQLAVLFRCLAGTGPGRLRPFAADPVGGPPQDDKGLPHRLVVGPPIRRRGGGRGQAGTGEQPGGVLAGAASHGDKPVEDLGLLRLGGRLGALAPGLHEVGSRLPADGGGHGVPPEGGNIRLRQRYACGTTLVTFRCGNDTLSVAESLSQREGEEWMSPITGFKSRCMMPLWWAASMAAASVATRAAAPSAGCG